MELLSQNINCPYCGESIDLLIDDSQTDSDYYEDCSVCCRPIRIKILVEVNGDVRVDILRDDDS